MWKRNWKKIVFFHNHVIIIPSLVGNLQFGKKIIWLSNSIRRPCGPLASDTQGPRRTSQLLPCWFDDAQRLHRCNFILLDPCSQLWVILPPQDIWEGLETLLVITTRRRVLLSYSRLRPGIQLSNLQCIEQPLITKSFWPQMSIMSRWKKSCFRQLSLSE